MQVVVNTGAILQNAINPTPFNCNLENRYSDYVN